MDSILSPSFGVGCVVDYGLSDNLLIYYDMGLYIIRFGMAVKYLHQYP